MDQVESPPAQTPPDGTSDEPAQINAISQALESLDERVREALQIAKSKDEIIDRLHAENQALRGGELARAQLPLLRDLIAMHDDIERIIAGAAVSVADLQFTSDLLIDVLARNGVQRFVPAVDEAFDSSVHAAVEVAVADAPEVDRTIASVSRAGFGRDDGLTLRAAEVVVRRWKEPRQVADGTEGAPGAEGPAAAEEGAPPADAETTHTQETSDTNG
jgi:molecular chaperone GrpE